MRDYIKNLAVLCRCLAYALMRGSARKLAAHPKAICIIQTAQMGDMVCTTPVFRATKQKHPESKVFVIGTAINEQVVNGNPDIDGYVEWSGSVPSMAQKIRALGCDFAVIAGPGFPTLAAAYLGGVPGIAAPKVQGGASPTETKLYKILRSLVLAIPHGYESYAPREYLRLLEPVGVHSDDTKKYIYFSDEARHSADKKLGPLSRSPYAVISPSSGNKIKRWPPERFAQVADYVAKKYMPVVVVGAAPDKDEVAAMMAHVSNPHILNLSEQLSVEELKAVIAGAALFVSVDTGPLYIAEALGVPTIDIVGPVSEAVQPPRGPRNILIIPSRKKAQLYIMNARVYDKAEAIRQAQATTVKELTDAVNSLLSV